MSWDGEAADHDVLFTLIFRARAQTELSKVLGINSRLTVAEAYDNDDEMLDLAISFGDGAVVSNSFELGQNRPNPFRTETTITYTLPAAAKVTFTISDAMGRTLEVRRTSGVEGLNTIIFQRNDLPAGVLVLHNDHR